MFLAGLDDITFEAIKTAALVLVALFGFNEIVSKIVSKIGQYTRKNDKIEQLDPEKIKTDIHTYMDSRYERLSRKYDEELDDVRKQIEENHTDTLAQLQEVKAELYFQTECNAAIMDGLVQLNCNGPVKIAKEHLDDYLNKRAHNVF